MECFEKAMRPDWDNFFLIPIWPILLYLFKILAEILIINSRINTIFKVEVKIWKKY